MCHHHREERGSVTVLVAGLFAIAGVLFLALGQLGGVAVEKASAQVAADAAALAGAKYGEAAAQNLAASNVGNLTSFIAEVLPDGSTEVQVQVTVGAVSARARARYVPPPPPPPPPTIPDTSIPETLNPETTIATDGST